MQDSIINYLKKTRQYSSARFVIELTLIALLLKFLFALLGVIMFSILGFDIKADLSYEQWLAKMPLILSALNIILFAAFETLIGQWFVIWLVSKLTKNIPLIILSSALAFSILHIEPLLSVVVFPLGVLLAWSFYIKRERSRWEAFWVTTSIHILHNFIVLAAVKWELFI